MAEIHELLKVNLGNQDQYVSIHGNDVEKPVLLLLHGGPGMAQLAKKYYENIKSQHKHYQQVQKCGHMIPFEQTEIWTNYLIGVKNKHF